MALTLKDLLAGQERLARQEQGPERVTRDQLTGLASAITGKGTEVSFKVSNRIFEDFVKQTQRREELLKDATAEQKAIFKDLEGTLIKLREAGKSDSVALRKSIEALARKLGATPNTNARRAMQSMLTPTTTAQARPARSTGTGSGVNLAGRAGATTNLSIGASFWNFLKTSNVQNVQALSPAAYPLYEDASVVGSDASVPVEAARMIGNEIIDGDDGGTTVIPIAPRGRPKPVAPRTRPLPPRGPTGQFRKPTIWDRIKGKGKAVARGAGTALSKVPIIQPLVTGGFMGYDEYQKSGNLGKALAVGTGSAVVGEVGAFMGGAAGGLLGPVGAFAGSLGGGIAGATAGAKSAGALYDAFTEPAFRADSNVKIQQEHSLNEQLKQQKADTPIIINNTSTQPTQPQRQNYNIFAPRGDVRPSEGALANYMNRTSRFI